MSDKQQLQCDITSIWNVLTCSAPFSPEDDEDEKVTARNEYLKKKSKNSGAISEEEKQQQQLEADLAAAAKKKELEDEFQTWLASRSGKSTPNITPSQTAGNSKGQSRAEAGSAYTREELEQEAARQQAQQQVLLQEEKRKQASAPALHIPEQAPRASTAPSAHSKAPEPTPEVDSYSPMSHSSSSSGRLHTPAGQVVTVTPDQALAAEAAATFERLLATQGIQVILHLPAKDGSVKSKRATVRCEKDSTRVVLDVPSKDKSKDAKQLKFHLYDIVLISKGMGSSIASLQSVSDKNIMRFTFHEKPELNMELDDEAVRDAVVQGFMGLITRRRSDESRSGRSSRSASRSRSSSRSSRSASSSSGSSSKHRRHREEQDEEQEQEEYV